jgi:putative transposase
MVSIIRSPICGNIVPALHARSRGVSWHLDAAFARKRRAVSSPIPPHRAAVQGLRGFIKTEVCRILNRLVALKKPGRLVVERLDFHIPDLSRRMNRLLQNCGRSVFRAKLAELEQRLGIAWEEVNPAYSSQECSCCEYVDPRNRRAQAVFVCLWCGSKMHADVNAGRNIRQRRSLSFGSVWLAKAAVLAELVRRFCERWPKLRSSGRSGQRGLPADPRLTNSYFKQFADAARSSGASRNLLRAVPKTPTC